MEKTKAMSKKLRTGKGRWLLTAIAVAMIGAAAAAGGVGGVASSPNANADPEPGAGLPAVEMRISIQTGGGGATTGWIEVLSFSWGMTQSGSAGGGGGGGAGKVSFHDFHFAKKVDKSSPQLMLACASGKHLPSVIFEISTLDAEGQKVQYMKYEFTDALITSYQISGNSGGGDLPMEEISMNFAKVSFEYLGEDPTPRNIFAWDIKNNKGL
jgi:type VI secretion system secreted protein Hcp